MENKIEKQPFNKRAFSSVAMFIAVLGLPYSGIMNHKLQFAEFSPERHFWMSVHNVSALLFVIFAVMHIWLNRRALVNYMHKVKGAVISREALYAILFVFIIVALFSSHALHVR
jgi:hypothetical protein